MTGSGSARGLGAVLCGVSLLLATAAHAPLASAGGLYRWVDAQGNVQFSDRPPTDGSVEVLEKPDRPTVEEVLAAEAAKAEEAEEAEHARRKQAALAARGSQATADGLDPDAPIEYTSRYSCEDARRFRDHYATNEEPQYRPTGDGQFRKLTQAELDAQLGQWRRAAELLCNDKGG